MVIEATVLIKVSVLGDELVLSDMSVPDATFASSASQDTSPHVNDLVIAGGGAGVSTASVRNKYKYGKLN